MQNKNHPAHPRRLHYIGAVMWPSFLSAAVATMFFFAMFDPEELAYITTWDIELSRQWGYTLGFFGFWAFSFLSSFITFVLLLPGNEINKITTGSAND